jgi:hypothetical protein
MICLRVVVFTGLALWLAPGRGAAQDPPPPLPLVALDVRASVPKFSTEPELAESRALLPSQLPGRGLGAEVGLHLYLFKLKAVTVGVGGQLTVARGTVSARENDAGQVVLDGVTERYRSGTPQLSLNFGDGEGWSYLSGGVGLAQRVLVQTGAELTAIDEERLRVVNYGGGARWFMTPHVAFTFDVRFHDIDPGTPLFDRPASPRSRLLIISAGASFK